MDQSFQEETAPTLKDRRRSNLMTSLSSLRVVGKTDVTIVCKGTEFLVHSVVLEASSVFFRTFLNSKFEEAKVKRVIIDEIDAEIMNAMLDFLYLGEIEPMENLNNAIKLLRASHLLLLDELEDHCWDSLVASLSVWNFIEILDLASEYERQEIEVKIFNYIIGNLSEVLDFPELSSLPRSKLQDLLSFSNKKRVCMDKLLVGLCSWVSNTVEDWKPFVNELFDAIDVSLLNDISLNSLLEQKAISGEPVEILRALEDLAAKKEVSYNHLPITVGKVKDVNCLKVRLSFLSEYRKMVLYDPVEDCRVLRLVHHDSLQQLDLKTMTWLPAKDLPFTGYKGAAVCQHDKLVYMAGGKLCPAYVIYNPETNVADHPGYGRGVDAVNAGLCYYKGHLYIIGGSSAYGEQAKNQVLHIAIGTQTWIPCKPMKIRRANPTVVTSEDHIYVAGGTNYPARSSIEFSTGCRNDLFWQTVHVPHTPSRVINIRCFVINSILHGLYYVNGELIHVKHDQETKRLTSNKCSLKLPGITDVFALDNRSNMVFVSTSIGLKIPEYIWEPDVDSWTLLTGNLKGKCEIPQDQPIYRAFTV